MNLPQFSNPMGFFALGDLIAQLETQTETSITLNIGHVGGSFSDPVITGESLEKLAYIPNEGDYYITGWIDVHYPCKSPHMALLRMDLPVEYHSPQSVEGLTKALFELLSIPADENYRAHYFHVGYEDSGGIITNMNEM